jgi:hypothetical protein
MALGAIPFDAEEFWEDLLAFILRELLSTYGLPEQKSLLPIQLSLPNSESDASLKLTIGTAGRN